MTQIFVPTPAKGFDYSDTPQKSPEWLAIRASRIGASELGEWMEKLKNGNPSQKRKDLEKRKAFEKAFNRPMEKFVTGAMLAGIEQEPFTRAEYEHLTGNKVHTAGVFYDKWSAASPDGLIGEDGGLELKWLQDSTYADIVNSQRVPRGYYLQCQGNLRATGRKWWDFVAANGNTGSFIVLRVERDEETIAEIDEAVREIEAVEPLALENVHNFSATFVEIKETEMKEVIFND